MSGELDFRGIHKYTSPLPFIHNSGLLSAAFFAGSNKLFCLLANFSLEMYARYLPIYELVLCLTTSVSPRHIFL